MAAFGGPNEGHKCAYKWFTSQYPLAIDELWDERRTVCEHEEIDRSDGIPR
jgi:hypothetical protein